MDYVYAGDLKGNLWKFDVTASSASSWTVAFGSGGSAQPLFQARDGAGAAQPITTKPEVMLHCVPRLPGYMVVTATGKYLGNTDFADTQTQTVYGLWDYGDDTDNSEYLGAFNRGSTPQLSNQPSTVTLLQQVEVYYGQPGNSNYTLRVLSENEIEWATESDGTTGQGVNPSNTEANNAGWYFDLPISKERVIRNLMIRNGKVIFISSIPKSSPCAAGGDSILHEINACSGGRLSTAQFDINDDAQINDDDMITISVPDPNNPDTTIDILVAPTGITYPEMIYPPKIMRHPDDTETKYFSTASGNIEMLREEGETRGIFYWRVRTED
jgi:type IV pilus assembly protein PilY1